MTFPEELRLIGERLYGRQWQTLLARDVPCNPRTVRRWLKGETTPYPAVVERVRSLGKIEGRKTR